MKRKIGRWLIEFDPDITRNCYSLIPVGTGCSCSYCRNFDAAAGQTFPTEWYELSETIGIDPVKPAELCHWYREPSGLYFTGGWFHFVGSIVSGEDVKTYSGNTGSYRFEELVPGLEFGFGSHLSLVRSEFAELSIVQLEFQTRVPWVLAEPEPTT